MNNLENNEIMQNNKPEYIFKITIIGNSNVGKTCLLNQYINNIYSNKFSSTIGTDLKTKKMKLDNKNIKLQIWDTAGQERFKSLVNTYLRNSNGIILVFDLTDRYTFDNLINWLDYAFAELENKNLNVIPIVLVGNKADCDKNFLGGRQISYDEANDFAIQYGLKYIEISVKNNVNVIETFDLITNICLINIDSNFKHLHNNNVNLKKKMDSDKCMCI